MPPASNEEQFKFLISCIRHSNNGKVDFVEVANECKIVSKGAAAKRYERLMKFHGIHQSQSGNPTASNLRENTSPSRHVKTPPPSGPSSKKRKLDNFAATTPSLNADDDEGLSNVKAESSTTIKAETIKPELVKDELTGEEGGLDSTTSTGSNIFQYPSNAGMGFDGADDSAMFDDFLAFGGSIKPEHGSQVTFDGGFAEEGAASTGMNSAIQSGNGNGLHESILIAD